MLPPFAYSRSKQQKVKILKPKTVWQSGQMVDTRESEVLFESVCVWSQTEASLSAGGKQITQGTRKLYLPPQVLTDWEVTDGHIKGIEKSRLRVRFEDGGRDWEIIDEVRHVQSISKTLDHQFMTCRRLEGGD
jgi:hypothetical protein